LGEVIRWCVSIEERRREEKRREERRGINLRAAETASSAPLCDG
jgi:hypothetical protein